jgi:hypothetical protein
MIRALARVLENHAIWIRNTSTIGLLQTDTQGLCHDTQKGRSSHSANRSRNISQTHFDLSASHMGSPSDLIPGPPRLVKLHSASQCQIAFLGHLDLDPDLA